MKKILNNKKTYYLKDILRLIFLFAWHIFVWLVFILAVYLLNYLIYRNSILSIIDKYKFLSGHIIILSPIISYILYVIYHEKGWLSIKCILWIYSMITIIVAVIIFTFF